MSTGMSDLQRAIGKVETAIDSAITPADIYIEPVLKAARLVVNGRKLRWCTQHISPAGSEAEECLVKDEWGRRHDCVIVDATIVLTPPGRTSNERPDTRSRPNKPWKHSGRF